MTDPHLLPNQIDLLVDGHAGFTARPMRAHLDDCDDCRARYDAARRAAEAVEALPHFTPRLPFADNIMAKVQVTEPWHVAVADGAERMVPPRGPLRALTIVGGSFVAFAISGAALWFALRWDLTSWLFNLGFERFRETVLAGAGSLAASALGAPASAALARGETWPLAVTAGTTLLFAIGAALGFRRLAATSRAHRS